jgi:hypothetical protein
MHTCDANQVVRSPPPAWEAEFKAWAQQQRLREGILKQYPKLVRPAAAADSYASFLLPFTPFCH